MTKPFSYQALAGPWLSRPPTAEEWPDFIKTMFDGFNGQKKTIVNADSPLHDRTAVGIGGIVTRIQDNGRLEDLQALPMLRSGNVGMVQDVATPLTSVDAGSDVTINIAAHSCHKGEGTPISYDAGSITGLAYATIYYVYTDDPNYEGGAVTYVATTTRTDVAGGVGRYLVGYITSVDSENEQTVDSATRADPGVFTSAGHTFTNGLSVVASGFTDTDWTALNGNTYTIANVSGNDYEIGVDTSAYSVAYTSGGKFTHTPTPPGGGGGGGGGGALP